jgi:hypothetical protein
MVFISARIDALSSTTLILASYAVGLVLLALSIVLAAAYARSGVIIVTGLLALILLQLQLKKIDPIPIAFSLSKDRYEAEVAKAAGPEPKFIVFTMKEGTGFPAGGAWEYFVFDASDEIDLPANARTEKWNRQHIG